MAWTTPKTNWSGASSAAGYSGDFFDYRDFNRIKNNIAYIFSIIDNLSNCAQVISAARTQYPSKYVLIDGDSDRTVTDFVYADEFNYFLNCIRLFWKCITNNATTYDETHSYANNCYDNGYFPTAAYLNEMEGSILYIYEVVTSSLDGRETLLFTLPDEPDEPNL